VDRFHIPGMRGHSIDRRKLTATLKLAGQPVQQLGMAGEVGLRTKILGRLD
jgi:hypothetical protein